MATQTRRFYLLNHNVGWGATVPPTGIEVGETLRLQELPGTARPLADAQGGFGGLTLPTALALDGAGRIYVLDGEQICRYDQCTGRFERLPTIGGKGRWPRQLWQPTGIAISTADDLYITDSGNRRVQIFGLKGLPLRAIWGPFQVVEQEGRRSLRPIAATIPAPCPAPANAQPVYPAGAWLPWDIALTCTGWAYVADYANGLIHHFDPRGCWRASYDGRDESGVVLQRPTHLALDRDENLYIVQEGIAYVTVLKPNGAFLRRVTQPSEVKGAFAPGAIGFDAAGRLFLSDAKSGCVYVYDDRQQAAHRCRGFHSSACAMTFATTGQSILADKLGGQLYTLDDTVNYVESGSLIIGPLDSEIYRCQWHKVTLAAAVAAGSYIRVDTFTAETAKQVGQILNLPENRWATGTINSQVAAGQWDCLISSEPGRFLWLRLTLHGDGVQTPQIQAVEVDYPRRSALRFLPGVFREDPVSADLLGRFLSITDAIQDEIGTTIANIADYFDPDATPAQASATGQIDFLTWLASWLGLALDPRWPEASRRRLVKAAHRLYALRGTVEGLRLHLALLLGTAPQVLEHFKLRRWLYLNQARLGDNAALWGADIMRRLQLDEYARIGDFQLIDSGQPPLDPFAHYAHQFTVYVTLPHADEQQRAIIRTIVAQAQPAHTKGNIHFVEPRMRIGAQSILGVNTIIGRYPAGVTTGQGQLGYDTVLSQSAEEAQRPTMRIGRRGRIGINTRLD